MYTGNSSPYGSDEGSAERAPLFPRIPRGALLLRAPDGAYTYPLSIGKRVETVKSFSSQGYVRAPAPKNCSATAGAEYDLRVIVPATRSIFRIKIERVFLLSKEIVAILVPAEISPNRRRRESPLSLHSTSSQKRHWQCRPESLFRYCRYG